MIRKILLAADASPHVEKTVSQAIEVAKLYGAAVVAMYAFKPPMLLHRHGTLLLGEQQRSLEDQAKESIGVVAERIAAEGLKVSALAVEGEPVEAILRIAETEHPDLIVVGSHSEGAGVALLDTVAERVVRRSSVSVLVVA